MAYQYRVHVEPMGFNSQANQGTIDCGRDMEKAFRVANFLAEQFDDCRLVIMEASQNYVLATFSGRKKFL